MRLFITSYQKAGTHQIMPMMHDMSVPMPNIVEGGGLTFRGAPEWFEGKHAPWSGPNQTCLAALRRFPHRAFGHIAYCDEYYEAVEERPTKILFNVRDPRDVVVAEYMNIRRHRETHKPGWAFLDMPIVMNGSAERLYETTDPLSLLIQLASYRWPNWLGWIGKPYVKLVHYEDLRLHPEETVTEIHEWVQPHLPPGIDTMLANLHPRPKNPTFRKGKVGEWKEVLNPFHKRLATKLLGPIMERLGYEP